MIRHIALVIKCNNAIIIGDIYLYTIDNHV